MNFFEALAKCSRDKSLHIGRKHDDSDSSRCTLYPHPMDSYETFMSIAKPILSQDVWGVVQNFNDEIITSGGTNVVERYRSNNVLYNEQVKK